MDTNCYNENQYLSMPDNCYSRPTQIAIGYDRFNYLTNEYTPSDKDEYILFNHQGFFLIYDQSSKACMFNAKYIVFKEKTQYCSGPAAVINEVVINKDIVLENDFSLLADLVTEIL